MMHARKSKVIFPLAWAFLATITFSEPQRVEVRQLQMGVLSTLTVYAEDTNAARSACGRAFEAIRKVADDWSDFSTESELRGVMRRAGEGPVPVSAGLFDILRDAREIAEATGGQIDPTIGPLVRLWREARRTSTLPDPVALSDARMRCGYTKMTLDSSNRTVRLEQAGMALDLGAFGKGRAGDLAIAFLRKEGYSNAMFEAGGDMVFGEAPPGERGWPVEVPDAGLPQFWLRRAAMSVSGPTMQFAEIAGMRYSHVVDPKTGYGLTNRTICVVLTDEGRWADPLSTAGTLMPEPAFRGMLKSRWPDTHAWVVRGSP